MNKINLLFKNNIRNKNLKQDLMKKFSRKFDKIFHKVEKEIQSPKKTLNVLDRNYQFNFKIENLKRFMRFKSIALVGMGGSILGSEAIYRFLKIKIKKKIYFFNDLDEGKIDSMKKKENLSKVLFIIISKSGNTVETLSNTFTLNIIKKNSKNIIIISEKKNNLLFELSKKLNLFYIEHKRNIGGRYSVLSEVGIVPAYLMGLSIKKFRSNIRECLKDKNKIFLKDSTIKLANLINSKQFNNLIFLNYSPKLENFLYWCQQLIAESLGKKNKGLLPVISNVPKDHHSLLQLYLDGPKDKLYVIFHHKEKTKEQIIIDKNIKLKTFLKNKKLGSVKNAQRKALIKIFKKKGTPFREFEIKNSDEKTLGELFAYFMLETIIIGKLLNLNPYDQPAVEQVKIYTKRLLT